MKHKYLILFGIILICISYIDVVYAKYILTRNFNINLTTSPFYFDATAQQDSVQLNNEAEIVLTIKNYLSENEYNIFDTNYEITLENNDKFAITIDDSNNGTILSEMNDNEVKVRLKALENAYLKTRENVVLKITSTAPYSKEIRVEVEVELSMLGRYVQYDNKLWVIMYNDKEHGLQMITDNVLDAGNVCLGYKDTTLQNAVDETTQNKDLNGDGVIENMTLDKTITTVNNLERSVYSYNNLVARLNNRCEELVTDKSKIAKNQYNEYLIRSVGSDSINKDSETSTLYTSSRLKKWPLSSSGSNYDPGVLNNKLKGFDTNYKSDLDQMGALNLKIAYDTTSTVALYWFATRYIIDQEDGTDIAFGARYMTAAGALTRRRLFSIDSANALAGPSDICYGVRPVITLDSEVQFSGVGTKTSPFVVK